MTKLKLPSEVTDLSNDAQKLVLSWVDTIEQEALKLPTKAEREMYFRKMIEMFDSGSSYELNKIVQLKKGGVVDVKTFIESSEYLNMRGEVYPRVMEYIEELNDESNGYEEAILTGAIGTGKTTIALITQAYQLYLLSRYESPHLLYGLAKSSELVFVFQNISLTQAKAVDYERFKQMIEQSPYFMTEFPFDKNLVSLLKFPGRIEVKPVSGEQTAAIGQNVFGGMIDEVNYMNVVEKSKQSMDGGVYDQALALYNSIARRRKSRFMKKGKLPGLLCLVSSKRYPGQFTDVKENEAKEERKRLGRTSIFVYDKRTWEVLPEDRFEGPMFPVFIGDEHRQPRILGDTEMVSIQDKDLILHVPIEYRVEFERDLMDALREIGGISTLARHPFIPDREKVAACFRTHESILSDYWCDFQDKGLSFDKALFVKPDEDRFVHMDLAISGDSAGVACGFVSDFKWIKRSEGVVEKLPIIRFDFTLEVRPPKGGEIQFYKIRELLYKLREVGLNIRWATLDSFQSTDTMQLLNRQGIASYYASMDINTLPYDITKTALYDGRVMVPDHPRAEKELISLERDMQKGKVDHPVGGSKDVSDAMAGVIYGLTMRREVYAKHGVPLTELPGSLRNLVVRAKSFEGIPE